jgi:HNH endonuclease
MRGTLEDRFWSKVAKSDDPPFWWLNGGCWEWTGTTREGYGRIKNSNRLSNAHVLSYQWSKGPIPDGYRIDHLCRNRRCVNPHHLDAVTHQTNIKRGLSKWYGVSEGLLKGHQKSRNATHCPQGHPYSGDNLFINVNGSRRCRQCNREVAKRCYYKKKAAI